MKIYATANVDGIIDCMDLSPQLGKFKSSFLVYFPELTELGISGCGKIDPQLFTDCIAHCGNLEKLVMTGCKQFSEYKIVKIASQVRNLRYFEVSNTSEVSYWNAYSICATLQKLKWINFYPKNTNHLHDFSRIIRIFRNVHFSNNIMRMFPFSGRYVRGLLYSVVD